MKKKMIFILMIFTCFAYADMSKDEVIKFLKDKKVSYYQNKKTKKETITILKNAIVTDDDLKYFKYFENLSDLSIESNQITDLGIENIKSIYTIERLSLSGVKLTNKSLNYIKKLTNIESLIIGDKQFTDVCLENISGLNKITRILLLDTSINGSGLKYFSDKKNLKIINLSGSPILDDGLKNISGLTNITDLDLSKTKITDEGIKYLVNMNKMERLLLSGINVTDKCVPYLKSIAIEQKTTDLFIEIYNTKISRNGVKELLSAGALVNCDYKDLSSDIR